MEKQVNNLKILRDKYITYMGESSDKTASAKKIADDLFSVGLTIYSKNFNIESSIYNSFTLSFLDDKISLHPEQVRIIKLITEYNALIVSAPTSFGKTFCIFEYISYYQPQTVILVVPTLALIDEYIRKIVRIYSDKFEEYKVYTNIDTDKEYKIGSQKNLFIVTHDRIVSNKVYEQFDVIDLLVIDEVYKLETDENDDRVLILNMAYYYLAKKSKKYVLLAPFIKSIDKVEKLDKKPFFHHTNYSPVVNKVIEKPIIDDADRFPQTIKVLEEEIPLEKTLVYIPTPRNMIKFVEFISKNSKNYFSQENIDIDNFVEWAAEEIHDEWYLIKAIENGYLVHNGQLPLGIRLLLLSTFDDDNSGYDRLICSSTLLEGVNTSAKNIIITRPSRKSDSSNKDLFSAFDFYNLVGRTGRLNKHLIGNAYYIKSQSDPSFSIEDAIKSIEFELSEETLDVDIQTGNSDKHDIVKEFYSRLQTDEEEYREKVGSKVRFNTCVKMLDKFEESKNILYESVGVLENTFSGFYNTILYSWKITQQKNGRNDKLIASIITSLLDVRRPNIKSIVNKLKSVESWSNIDTNELISEVIKVKNSLEHQFYNRCQIIDFFLEKNNAPINISNTFKTKVIGEIEDRFYINSPCKKMLRDIGVYEYVNGGAKM